MVVAFAQRHLPDEECPMSTALLTDSGLETWLVFHRGVALPDFAAFPLLDNVDGRALLAEYFRDHLRIAAQAGTGLVLETPTWRANADWGARLGYDAAALERVNRDAVAFLWELGAEFDGVELIVSGNLGPRGDGYDPEELLTPAVAAAYHRAQIDSFAAAGADRVTMLTATHAGEAIGVVQAAVATGIAVVIAFTVETDGRLPSRQPLHEAITEVDAATDGAALHFGVNCAHPDHFSDALGADPAAIDRIALLRANASRASHAELDEAEELDDGDPAELAELYARLRDQHPHIHVLGGCCGTDSRHVAAIAQACVTVR
jgi:homocysteine S-methyltransferase